MKQSYSWMMIGNLFEMRIDGGRWSQTNNGQVKFKFCQKTDYHCWMEKRKMMAFNRFPSFNGMRQMSDDNNDRHHHIMFVRFGVRLIESRFIFIIILVAFSCDLNDKRYCFKMRQVHLNNEIPSRNRLCCRHSVPLAPFNQIINVCEIRKFVCSLLQSIETMPDCQHKIN